MQLQKPHRPIPGIDHIRFPSWCDRQAAESFVRRYTERGFDLRLMEPAGERKRSLIKGLRRVVQMQQALLKYENWDGTPRQK